MNIFDVVEKGDVQELRNLIVQGSNVNAKNSKQELKTPLMIASAKGNLEVVKLLILAGADINARDRNKSTSLIEASDNGHIKIVKILIDSDADINAKNSDDETALQKAKLKGHIEIVKILKEAGSIDDLAKENIKDISSRKTITNRRQETSKIISDIKHENTNLKSISDIISPSEDSYNEYADKEKMIYCSKCGVANQSSAKFCSGCGSKLIIEVDKEKITTIHYAGFWKRFVATFIDGIILMIIECLIGSFVVPLHIASFATAESNIEAIQMVFMFDYFFISTFISWIYYTVFESSPKQATLGKMALAIKVTDLNGNRISFYIANGRYWSKIISGIILFIGFIMAAFTKKKQALHDMIAGTLVVGK